jgi:hypothetical protein
MLFEGKSLFTNKNKTGIEIDAQNSAIALQELKELQNELNSGKGIDVVKSKIQKLIKIYSAAGVSTKDLKENIDNVSNSAKT